MENINSKENCSLKDEKGRNCCATDKNITFDTKHRHIDDDGHNHGDSDENESTFKKYLPATISFMLLVAGIVFEQTDRGFLSTQLI
jgi:hypothetical protein